jgi:phosphatidylserine decarboxylase
MKLHQLVRRWVANEDLNFLLTNRIPRVALTHLVGRLSRVEQPLVRDALLACWRAFTDLELEDTEDRQFRSMHDCFTRRLRPGARPVDPDPTVLVSPCDAILGASGRVADATLWQAKGFPYRLEDLIPDPGLAESLHDASYATLRITSSMYHRFHAPGDCSIDRIDYLSGDTWNVNPIALRRVERLFCRNERAVLHARLEDGSPLVMVAVAAILVASIRLHFVDVMLHLRYRGPHRIDCNHRARRGEELGCFEQGSTIIVFAPPPFRLVAGAHEGMRLHVGKALFSRSAADGSPALLA